MRRGLARTLLITLMLASVLVAAADAWLFLRDWHGAENLVLLWSLAFGVLVAMWIDADSRQREAVYRPYEYGFLIYLAWPLYLPYYLFKTRRGMGIVWLGGFVLAYLLATLARLVIWLGQ